MSNANEIKTGDRVRILKGCRRAGVAANQIAMVKDIADMRDQGLGVRVALNFLTGFSGSSAKIWWVRHPNRLADDVVNMNTGDPTRKIQIAKVAS